MTMHYPHLASRLFNTPLLIHPGKLDAIVAGLSGRFGVMPAPSAYVTPTGTREPGGYRVLDNGVAVLEVFGALAHRGGLQADSSYIQGYDGLARQLETALRDPAVGAILLNVDSPGGEVSGAFQLASQIHAARAVKPIAAVASDMAASAGYLLASAAQTVSVTTTGVVGSIGVATCHVDMSKALAGMGMAITCLYAGAHKIDGNPYQPLPPDVAAQIQADVDHYYALFLDTVAAHRPATDVAALRATEARTYIGEQALAAKLADFVETPDQAIARLAARISSPSRRAMSARSSSMFFNKKRLNLDISVSDPEPATDPEPPVESTPNPPPASGTAPPPSAPAEPEPAALSAREIVRMCNTAGEPKLALIALQTPHTRAQLQARIEQAGKVRKICALAQMPDIADGLIAHGADEDGAKMATWDALAARGESTPIDPTPPTARQTMTRAAFTKLNPQQAREFIRDGGTVTD